MTPTPTDPVKELIEAAGMPVPDNIKHIHSLIGRVCEKDPDLTVQELYDSIEGVYNLCGEYQKIMVKLNPAIPSLSAMVAREEAVREYIKELRVAAASGMGRTHSEAATAFADRLEQIFPKEGAKDSDRLDIPAFLRRGDD